MKRDGNIVTLSIERLQRGYLVTAVIRNHWFQKKYKTLHEAIHDVKYIARIM